MSNNPSERAYAIERSLQAIEIADGLGADLIGLGLGLGLGLGREGIHVPESQDPT
jgi:hypothetical protein